MTGEQWSGLVMAGLTTAILLAAAGLRLARGPRRWGLRDGLLALLLLVWIGSASTAAAVQWSQLALPGDPPAEPSLAQAVGGTVLGGAVATLFSLGRAWPARRRLGLRGTALRHWGLAVALVPVFLGVAVSWSLVLEALGQAVEPQRIVQEVLADPSHGSARLALVYGALVAPLVEELVFRGLLLVPLAERYGAGLAVLLTGLLFGLLHLADPTSVVPLCLFGVALGLLRLRSGSLGPPVLLHVGNNLLAFSLALAGVG